MTEQVHITLRELKTEAAHITDEAHREHLEEVITRIQARLDAPEDAEHHDTLLERLEESVVRLETDYPALAAAMRRAINILSTGGV
ncbi:MAG: hypothetical protein OHK0046_05210 [Anaerolineae bacterium]